MKEKLKILMVAFDFPPQVGGVATYSEEMAQSFHDLGHEVIVLTKARGAQKSFPFKTIALNLPNSGLLSVPVLSFHIRKWIQQFKPDFIFNSLWLPDATATYLAVKSLPTKTPYVLVVHGMEILSHSWKGKLRSQSIFFKNDVFAQANSCICISEYTKNLVLEKKLCSLEKIQVIHNGVNPHRFQWDNTTSAKLSYPQLLTVARLMPHKGIDQVLKALPEVTPHFPKLQYKIVGSGPDRERLEKIVAELGLKNHVQFLGSIDNHQLPSLYGQADLFILLSRQIGQNVEGFGLVILEAALAKTASLGGRSGGLTDAIVEGKTGWLVDPEDTSSIAQKLIEILKNPEELTRYSQQAFEHTLNERTWAHASQKVLDSLREVL